MRWRHLRRPDAEQTYTAQFTASVADGIGKDERVLEEWAGRRWPYRSHFENECQSQGEMARISGLV